MAYFLCTSLGTSEGELCEKNVGDSGREHTFVLAAAVGPLHEGTKSQAGGHWTQFPLVGKLPAFASERQRTKVSPRGQCCGTLSMGWIPLISALNLGIVAQSANVARTIQVSRQHRPR
jgi:hypothetical protein